DRARPAAPVAARVVPHLEALRTRLLDDERLLCHVLRLPSLRERQAESAQQRVALLVRLRARRDRDVETADRRDVVVVDLRKDDLLADPERVVAPPVERARV